MEMRSSCENLTIYPSSSTRFRSPPPFSFSPLSSLLQTVREPTRQTKKSKKPKLITCWSNNSQSQKNFPRLIKLYLPPPSSSSSFFVNNNNQQLIKLHKLNRNFFSFFLSFYFLSFFSFCIIAFIINRVVYIFSFIFTFTFTFTFTLFTYSLSPFQSIPIDISQQNNNSLYIYIYRHSVRILPPPSLLPPSFPAHRHD